MPSNVLYNDKVTHLRLFMLGALFVIIFFMNLTAYTVKESAVVSLIIAVVVFTFFDELFMGSKPIIYYDGFLMPGGLLRRYVFLQKRKVCCDEVIHISKCFCLKKVGNKLIRVSMHFKIYLKDKDILLTNPTPLDNTDIEPLLKTVFRERWNEIYSDEHDNTYFSKRELSPIKRMKLKRLWENRHFVIGKLLSYYLEHGEFKSQELPVELKEYEGNVLFLIEKFYKVPVDELAPLPVVDMTGMELFRRGIMK